MTPIKIQVSTDICAPPSNRPIRPLPKSAPVHHKLSSTLSNASAETDAKDLNFHRLAKEMKGHFVGAMPPLVFIDKFLQKPNGLPEHPQNEAPWARVSRGVGRYESLVYEPFVEAVAAFTPKMKFVNTHKYPDTDAYGYAPDVSAYYENDPPDSAKRTDFSKMSLFIEFKPDAADDPFQDPPVPAPKKFDKKMFHFEKDAQDSMLCRGQIGRYSAAISGTQFRLHVFSVLICGRKARFIRWDRAGAVVSQSFDYIQSPDILASFFWRYSHASDRERGHDPSVSNPSKKESTAARNAFYSQRDEYYDKFLKVMVPDYKDPLVEKPVLIPLPLEFVCRSPFARATRPTPAYDPTDDKLVFVKDYWRPKDNLKEGDIYAILHAHGVQHIAEFGAGNDVRDHVTRTGEFARQTWPCHRAPGEHTEPMMPELVQYRMLLPVIGWNLDNYDCTRNFVSAVMDAMEAHDQAYFKAKVLHRDVSVGNILITANGGLLIDWDMAVIVDPKPKFARRPKRTGTWQFMSIRLLEEPGTIQDIEDDRESAFWVILWTALRTRYSHRVSPGKTAKELLLIFDDAYCAEDGQVKGGDMKSSFLTKPIPVDFDGVPHLNALLTELRRAFLNRILESTDDTSKLRTESWLVNLMQEYLGKNEWPTNDAAVSLDFVLQTTTVNKCSHDQQALARKRPRTATEWMKSTRLRIF